jgi:hypothetical protein
MALVRGGISTGHAREIGAVGSAASKGNEKAARTTKLTSEGSVMWWIVVVVWDLTMGKFF